MHVQHTIRRNCKVMSVLCVLGLSVYSPAAETSLLSFPLKGFTYPAEYERGNRTYLIKGEPGFLQFYLYGERDRIIEPRLILDTSQELDLLCSYLSRGERLIELLKVIGKSDLRREGIDYSRWIISLNEELFRKKLLAEPNLWGHIVTLFFEPTDGLQKQSKFYWHLEVDGKKGEEKKVEVSLLDELPINKNPARIKLFPFGIRLFGCPDDKTWSRLVSLYDKVGFSGGVKEDLSKEMTQKLIDHGFEIQTFTGWGGWAGGFWGVTDTNVDKLTDKPDDIVVTLKNGKKTEKRRAFCLTYLIENSEKGSNYFREARAWILLRYQKGLAGYQNDYELKWTGDTSPINSCFCPRCKRAFSEFSGINANELSPQEILSKYKSQWIEFRYWQHAKMMEIFTRIVKSIDPHMKSVLCSAPVYRNRLRYPIDIKMCDNYVDEHWPQLYTRGTRLYREVEYTVSSLKKPVVAVLNTCFPVGEHYAFSARDVRLNTLASASCGPEGIAYFTGSTSLDGDYLKAIDEAGNEIAILEDFFLDGKRRDDFINIETLPKWRDSLFVKVHQLGEQYLIGLFNYNPGEDIFIKIIVPNLGKGEYSIYDPITEACIAKSSEEKCWLGKDLKRGVCYQVPAYDVKFLLFGEHNPNKAFRAILLERSARDKYEKLVGGKG